MIDLIAVNRIELSKSEPIEIFKDSTGSGDSDFFRLLNDKIKDEDKIEEKSSNDEESPLAVKENNILQEEDEDGEQSEKRVDSKFFDVISELTIPNQEGFEKESDLKLTETENIKLDELTVKSQADETDIKLDAKVDTKIESNIETLHELLSALEPQKIDPINAEKIIASIKEFLASPEAANLPEKSKKSLSQLMTVLDDKLKSAVKQEAIVLPDKVDLKQIVADIGKNLNKNEKATTLNEKAEAQTVAYKLELLKDINPEAAQVVVKQEVFENKKTDALFSNNRNSFNIETRLNTQNQTRNDFNQSREFREQIDALLDKGKLKIKDSKNASFEIKLNPKELGNLNMNIGVEQGILTGRFVVENEQAKNLLMENLLHIKTQLEQSGVAIGDFQVNVRKQNRDDSEDMAFKTARVVASAAKVNSVVEYNSMALHDGSLNLVI